MSKKKVAYLLGNTTFWLFTLISVGVVIKLAFFPKDLDILELALILLWRYILGRVRYHTGSLLISFFILTLLIPTLLSVNQPVVAGEFAIWLFYLLIIELVLNVRSIFWKG